MIIKTVAFVIVAVLTMPRSTVQANNTQPGEPQKSEHNNCTDTCSQNYYAYCYICVKVCENNTTTFQSCITNKCKTTQKYHDVEACIYDHKSSTAKYEKYNILGEQECLSVCRIPSFSARSSPHTIDVVGQTLSMIALVLVIIIGLTASFLLVQGCL